VRATARRVQIDLSMRQKLRAVRRRPDGLVEIRPASLWTVLGPDLAALLALFASWGVLVALLVAVVLAGWPAALAAALAVTPVALLLGLPSPG
jgi:hypothetical protein